MASMLLSIWLILILTQSMCNGFRYQSHKRIMLQHHSTKFTTRLHSTEEPSVGDDSTSSDSSTDVGNPDKKLFDMNQRVRLGRSKDQEGKSNIWSIEPTMKVEGEEGQSQVKKNLLVGGVVIGAAIASLPLFLAFSKLLPGAKR